MKDHLQKHLWIIVTGAVIGIAAVILVASGNPANMGFCIACFIRDTAGGMKLHTAGVVQYVRPEIIGLVLGAFFLSLFKKEFSPRGGSSTVVRFVLGFFVMVGALMFLGCPLRMVLRIGGGDWNALVGLVGFLAGIAAGVVSMNMGFSLKRTYRQTTVEGALFPAMMVVSLILLLAVPSLLAFSEEGPGAARAYWLVALALGLVGGVLAQKSRMCMAGAFRDVFLFRDFHLFWGTAAVLVAAIIGNLIAGKFNPGFLEQPIAHTDGIWNFLGMSLVGWASVLLGGCPMRQLILAGEGNSDSAVTVIGMTIGAAFCHNFALASSGKGTTVNGRVAVIIGLVVTLAITLTHLSRKGENA